MVLTVPSAGPVRMAHTSMSPALSDRVIVGTFIETTASAQGRIIATYQSENKCLLSLSVTVKVADPVALTLWTEDSSTVSSLVSAS